MRENNHKKIVTVITLVYNHEPYIRQCLEGIVMQKTDFFFEVLVHDDASTDSSANIIREYEEKYPDIIKPIYQTENQHSKKVGIFKTFIYPIVKSKYIAMCEGDDYWTDPYKLQKQVDFLETHSQYDLCSHRFRIYNAENKVFINKLEPTMDDNVKGIEFDAELGLYISYYQTMTLVFRSRVLEKWQLSKSKYLSDLHLCYFLTNNKKGYCLNQDGAVYRLSNVGIFSKKSLYEKLNFNYNMSKDIYINNQNDITAHNIFLYNKKIYFTNYIRTSILEKKYSKKLKKHIIDYLKDEIKYTGVKGVIYSLKKMTLSFIKSRKSK